MENDLLEVFMNKLGVLYPNTTAREQVVEILNQYGTEAHEKETVRVRLDILKLAGTSLEDVKKWVGIAKKDYRDILASAEYPGELLAPTWRMPKDEVIKIQTTDRDQYKAWVSKK
jgi:hypothetical protein